MLKCVTFTGADDKTRLKDMWALSRRYPFIEWGILYHSEKEGTGRYPSIGWIHELIFEQAKAPGPNFSLHLCGKEAVSAFVRGVGFFSQSAARFAEVFPRVQLNANFFAGHPFTPADAQKACELHPSTKVITQHNKANELLAGLITAPNHQVLFDSSGGRGVVPIGWPIPLANKDCGYAGGVSAATIGQVLTVVESYHPKPSWIDLESSLRTQDDLFEPWEAKQVAVRVQAFLYKRWFTFGWRDSK